MNNQIDWSEMYNDEPSGPSTVEFFPDMAQFEQQEDKEHQSMLKDAVSEWALKKIGTLQSRLEVIQNAKESKLYRGSNYQQRLSSHIIFSLANEVFGYNGWSSEIVHIHLVDETIDEENEQYSARFDAIVRVILKDGTYNDELGTGEAMKLPHKHMCYNKSKKHAITDGLKNAILGLRDLLMEHELKNFGAHKIEDVK